MDTQQQPPQSSSVAAVAPLFQANRSFRPRRQFVRSHRVQKAIHKALTAMTIREATQCPPGVELDEWLAVNVFDFYNQCNVIFGNLADQWCSPSSCPQMAAGPKYKYLWADGEKIIKPQACSAPEYMHQLMTWIEGKVDDPTLFPTDIARPFPAHFLDTVRTIFKRLFRLYSHVYYTHFRQVEAIGADTYLNVSFKHFVFFVERFELIDAKELKPLDFLIQNIHNREAEQQQPQQQPQKPAILVTKATPDIHAGADEEKDERRPPTPPKDVVPTPPQVTSARPIGGKRKSRPPGKRVSMYYSGQRAHINHGTLTLGAELSKGDVSLEQIKYLDMYSPQVAIVGHDFDADLMVDSLRSAGYTIACVVDERRSSRAASATADQLEQWARVRGISRVVRSMDELVADRSVNTVVICEHSMKPRHLRKLLSCPDKFLVFSPMSGDLDMREALVKYGHSDVELTSFVNAPLRMLPVVGRMHELLTVDRVCGSVHFIQASINVDYRHEMEKMSSDQEVLVERMSVLKNTLMLGLVDVVTWFLGGDSIDRISSAFQRSSPAVDIDDMVLVTFKSTRGIMGQLTVCMVNNAAPAKFKVEVQGERGQINLADNRIFFNTLDRQHQHHDGNHDVSLKLLMDDHSLETMTSMPLSILATANMHFWRALKLYLFDSQSAKAALSPNQMALVERLLVSRCGMDAWFEHSCTVAAVEFQKTSMPCMRLVDDILQAAEEHEGDDSGDDDEEVPQEVPNKQQPAQQHQDATAPQPTPPRRARTGHNDEAVNQALCL